MHHVKMIQKAIFRISLCLFMPTLLIGIFYSLHVVPIAHSAPTAVIMVTSTADNLISGDSLCTLREAISTTNGGTTDCGTTATTLPIITFSPTLTEPLELTRSGNEDNNHNGDLDIKASVIISGNGTDTTILDGNGNSRLFEIITGSVTIANLTLQSGRATTADGRHGGAIYQLNPTDTLTITNVILQNNQATNSADAHGGGIYAVGDLVVISSTLTKNYAGGNGGALYQQMGSLTVITSNILSNYSAVISSTGSGGGIYTHENCAGLSISGTTLAENQAHQGGGLFSQCAADSSLTNSTVSTNQASEGSEVILDRSGGGILHNTENSTLTLKFVTVYSNVINTANISQTGGGIAVITGTVALQSSIVVSNYMSSDNREANCYTVITTTLISEGYNFLGRDSACPADGPNDQIGVPVLLLPLADNGGGTLTHAPAFNSPLINSIPSSQNGCGTEIITDQRNQPRPDTLNDECDVGAYEIQPVPNMFVQGNGRIISNGDTTPSILDDTLFETITFGDPAVAHTFTIQNLGIADLLLTPAPAITLAQGTLFTVTTYPTTTPIVSGSQTTVVISMTSTAAGTFTDTVFIRSNDNNQTPFTFVIRGTIAKADTVTRIVSNLPNPTARGQRYAVTVAVTSTAGTPTGYVYVTDSAGATCPISLSTATNRCELTSQTLGETTITATYPGDDNFNGSSDSTDHLVDFHDLGLSITVTHQREMDDIFLVYDTTLKNTRSTSTLSATVSHSLSGNFQMITPLMSIGNQPFTAADTYTYTTTTNAISGTWTAQNIPPGNRVRLRLIVYKEVYGWRSYVNESKLLTAFPADDFAQNDSAKASIKVNDAPYYLYLPLIYRPVTTFRQITKEMIR